MFFFVIFKVHFCIHLFNFYGSIRGIGFLSFTSFSPCFILKIFYFWDYNYIISSSPFLSSNPPIYPYLLSLKFMALFSLVIVTCICMCVHTYIYIRRYINTTCSVCILLLLCILWRLTFCHWTANWCHLFGGSLFFYHSQNFLVVCL